MATDQAEDEQKLHFYALYIPGESKKSIHV